MKRLFLVGMMLGSALEAPAQQRMIRRPGGEPDPTRDWPKIVEAAPSEAAFPVLLAEYLDSLTRRRPRR